MTSIIKNQLIKHLSKFTKNLKPDQISLDVVRGNSKLKYVEINEDVLTDILELPCWLLIKKAYCTGVVINVPWTKLKTCPIEIFIDDIVVDVEITSDQSQKSSKNSSKSNLNESGSYGFINKIVENMSLYINTVEINFDSDVFGGSFMLQRLSVESRSPGWAQVKDLRQTRLTNPSSTNSLMFKQISWHLLRIEASAKSSKDEKRSKINAPLRLITSGGKMRIALKKNNSDGSVVHARIQTILDDILWVATLPQLRSAISFASYVVGLAQKSSKNFNTDREPISKELSAVKNESINKPGSLSSAYKVFFFDQTSYHLHVKKIDLHLCDDAHKASDYPPNWNIESGAMQVTFVQLLIDIYPNTLVATDRSTWMRYPNPSPAADWLRKNLSEQLSNMKNNNQDKTISTRLERCWPQMIGFIVVLRIYDLTVQCVSDMNTKKDALTNFLESQRHLHSLPNDQQVVHLEFASFFHPHSETLPVPKPAIYSQIGPFSILFNDRTARWLFYVIHTLQSAFEEGNFVCDSKNDLQMPVIKLNLIMIRVLLLSPVSYTNCRFPLRFVLSISTLCICSSIEDLSECCEFSQLTKMLQNTSEKCKISENYEISCFFVRASPIWIETDNGPQTKGLPFLNDVYFSFLRTLISTLQIAVIGIFMLNDQCPILSLESKDEVSLIIDHFQFIQLIRCTEQLDGFLDLLTEDFKHYDIDKLEKTTKLKFFANIPRLFLYIILEHGLSPNLNFNGLENYNINFSESSSDIHSFERQSTVTNTTEKPQKMKTEITMDDFPVFPVTGVYELSPTSDETTSVALSIDDENFDYDDMFPFENEDLLAIPDMAEEAVVIDEMAKSDNIYQCIMAKQINLLLVTCENIECQGIVENKDLNIEGNVKLIDICEKLYAKRTDISEMLKTSTLLQTTNLSSNMLQFSFNSPSSCKAVTLTVDLNNANLKLDDEIVSQLSEFTKEDRITTNKIRLSINVRSSCITIVDRKKLKPLRISIQNMIIEQEED